MSRRLDWPFWAIVTTVSVAFLLAFLSLGDEPTVSATEIRARAQSDSGAVRLDDAADLYQAE